MTDTSTKSADMVTRLPEGAPRRFNTYHRKTPFWRSHRFAEGEPAWTKVGYGLIAVVDGSPRKMIAPGLIFAVEQDGDGQYRIATYGYADGRDTDGIGRPYAWETVRSAISAGKLARRGWVSYEDMVVAVRKVLPMAWVPTEEEFYAEYGL